MIETLGKFKEYLTPRKNKILTDFYTSDGKVTVGVTKFQLDWLGGSEYI